MICAASIALLARSLQSDESRISLAGGREREADVYGMSFLPKASLYNRDETQKCTIQLN